LSEYLLGQADPISRADAVRHLRQDADDSALAEKIASELKELFPAAELPKLPQAPTGSRFGGGQSQAPKQPAGEPLPVASKGDGISPRQTRIFAALAGAGVILVVAVLAIAGVFSGDDTDPDASGSASTQTGTEDLAGQDPTDPSTPIPDGEEISRVPLTSPSGAKTAGAAVVGISGGTQPYLDLVLTDLPDPPKDRAYLAWFMFDENNGYPMAVEIRPTKGTYENRLAIPTAIAEPISRARAIEISLSDTREIITAAQDALEAGQFEIERPGETVLRGDVPRENPAGQEDQQAPGEAEGE
jgi:hypothetical protein